jgi:hypothetical protein
MNWMVHSLVLVGEAVCFILVIVQMFQHGQTGLGIACLVGVLLCGIGGLVAFVYGWMKSNEWKLQNVMYVWTGCLIASIILGVAMPISFAPTLLRP